MAVVQVRDPLTMAPLAMLPPSPESGWLSATVTERLWRPDRLDLELDARVAAAAGVVENRVLVADGLVFLVESVQVSSDEQSRVSALATVTGFDLATVPHPVLPAPGQSHRVVSGVGETAMKTFVGFTRGEDANPAEARIPALDVFADQGRGGSGEWRARYQQLSDLLELIGQETGLGYRTAFDATPVEDWPHGRPVFDVIAGEHLPQRLAIEQGTARAEELQRSIVDRLTHVYVGGDGEGAARTIVQRHTGAAEPVGHLRRSEFVDARDTDATATLESRGDARLAETAGAGTFDVELAEGDGWRYGEQLHLGDTLTYSNRWGDDRVVRIVEVETTRRESLAAPDRRVILDREWPEPGRREVRAGGTEFA